MLVPVLLGDSNFSDINREHHTAVASKSGKLLKYVKDNFLSQILSLLTRKGMFLYLFMSTEGIMEDETVADCLSHSGHEMF